MFLMLLVGSRKIFYYVSLNPGWSVSHCPNLLHVALEASWVAWYLGVDSGRVLGTGISGRPACAALYFLCILKYYFVVINFYLYVDMLKMVF